MPRTKDPELCPDCKRLRTAFAGKQLNSSRAILACLKHFRDKKQEYFVVLSLDSEQKLIARRIVTIGLINVTLAHPREVFAGPLTDLASSIVIAHNHPSGNPQPSKDDIDLTEQLAAAGRLLGVPILDHIIIASSGHFSFKMHGVLHDQQFQQIHNLKVEV